MNLSRREFSSVMAAALAAGFPLHADAATNASSRYDVPKIGNVHMLHLTDCHAQLLPSYFREPSVNLGVGHLRGQLPHLVGEHLLKAAHIKSGTPEAHAFTYLDFERAAKQYGKVGGFAHLATLVKQIKATRPDALVLDGGDTWQGSATALWTQGQDMVDAAKLLGVNIMTGHWDFTYGEDRIKQIVDGDFAGQVEFLAQNVKTSDFGDAVFKPYVIREMNGVQVAVVGQADPRWLREITDAHATFACRSFGVLIHTKNQEISAALQRGDSALSRLDGEWWLRFAADSFEE